MMDSNSQEDSVNMEQHRWWRCQYRPVSTGSFSSGGHKFSIIVDTSLYIPVYWACMYTYRVREWQTHNYGTVQNLDSGLWTGPWTGLWTH